MGRKTHEVNRECLIASITEAESNGPLENRSILAETVTKIYNAMDGVPRAITFSVVTLRIQQWGLDVKTPKGRRGRQSLTEEQKAAMKLARKSRVSKAEKFENSEQAQIHFAALRATTPNRFHGLVDKIESGSRAAAQKLFCLQCCGFVSGEVRRCTGVRTCPIFMFRPYQDASEEEMVSDEIPSTQPDAELISIA